MTAHTRTWYEPEPTPTHTCVQIYCDLTCSPLALSDGDGWNGAKWAAPGFVQSFFLAPCSAAALKDCGDQALKSFVVQLPYTDAASFDVIYPLQTLKPIAAQLRSRLQADVAEDDHTWREKMERAVLNIPLTVTGRLSQPVVSMYKLINMQVGDTFPITIGEGVEVQIDGEDAFLGELGEVGASAAINLKSRLK